MNDILQRWKRLIRTTSKIEQFGVKVYPIEDHSIKKEKRHDWIILGYGQLTKEEIVKGVFRLHQALYNTNAM